MYNVYHKVLEELGSNLSEVSGLRVRTQKDLVPQAHHHGKLLQYFIIYTIQYKHTNISCKTYNI